MKNSPRLAPTLVALSVVLSAAPQAALARGVLIRPLVAPTPAEIPRVTDTSVTGIAAPLAPALAPALTPAAVALVTTAVPALAAEAAAPQGPVERANGASSLRERLRDLVKGPVSAFAFFDHDVRGSGYGLGFQGGLPPIKLPRGVTLDQKPQPPALGEGRQVLRRAVSANMLSNSVETAHAGTPAGFSLVALDADPDNPASIEAALRTLIDGNPRDYQIPSSELGTLHVEKVDFGDSADPTYHAAFRQWKIGDEGGSQYAAAVAGASLSFVVKLIDGKAYLVPEATASRLYPGIAVDTTPKFDDSALRTLAHQRLRPDHVTGFLAFHIKKAIQNAAARFGLAASADPIFITREIIYGADKQWHTANLYRSSDLDSVVMAVDVATGKTFAWDGRVPARKQDATSANANVVFGRGNTFPTGTDNDKIGSLPMPFMKVKDAKGKVIAITDENGMFSLHADGSDPIQVTITLDNVRSRVSDQNRKNPPMTISMAVVPGKTTQAIFNPKDDPELAANVNSLVYATNHIDWFENEIGLSRLKGATIANINTNLPQDCNAFFDPSANTLNLFHRSKRCENTAQPSVIEHEAGHWVLQMHSLFTVVENAALKVFQPLSGFVDDTVNENFADYGAISHGGNPNLGVGFLLATPDKPLRSGLDMDRYDAANSDPHQPAQMQFWYQSEVELAQAGLYAAKEIHRIILSTVAHNMPGDMSSSVTQVVLAFMKNGKIPEQVSAILKRVAQAHNLPWSATPPTSASTSERE